MYSGIFIGLYDELCIIGILLTILYQSGSIIFVITNVSV